MILQRLQCSFIVVLSSRSFYAENVSVTLQRTIFKDTMPRILENISRTTPSQSILSGYMLATSSMYALMQFFMVAGKIFYDRILCTVISVERSLTRQLIKPPPYKELYLCMIIGHQHFVVDTSHQCLRSVLLVQARDGLYDCRQPHDNS